MKKGVKIGIGVAAALIVVLAVAVYVLLTSLDSLIVAAVERFGAEATRAEVALDGAEVSVTTGEGALRGLRVGNPKGFDTESALRLGEISLKLEVDTITSDPVVIKEIVVQAPEVTYELGEAGSNIDALKRNVDRYAKQKSSGGGGQGSGGATAPKLIIENLYLRDGTIKVSITGLGGKTENVRLPAIHLRNIGEDTGGATPDQVMKIVFSNVSGSVGKAVAPLALDVVTGAAEGGAEGAKDTLEKGAEEAEDTFKKLLGD